MRLSHGLALTLIALTLPPAAAAAAPTSSARPDTADAAAPQAERRMPSLRIRTVARGLDHPWDVQQAPKRRLVVTERDRARISVVRRGKRRTLADLNRLVWVSGETGLMSLAVDGKKRFVWACHGAHNSNGDPEVRVSRWKANPKWRKLKRRKTIVAAIPATSGRHGGCRLMLPRRGKALLIGTGDAAVGTIPRDLDSKGGKVLRVHRHTGAAMSNNPWANARTNRKYVWTYGHRNVQGLAQRGNGSLWSVEHGPGEDDEVNLLVRGGDYGWNPVPGYDSSVPMTDHDLPGVQQDARWSSGSPTLATSGAAWVKGRQWGALRGTLAVAALKESRILFMRFNSSGQFVRMYEPSALQQFGRLRSVTSARNGDLLITTDNGDGEDRVLRVRARR